MIADLVIVALVAGYGAYIIFRHRKGGAGGCAGCPGCSGSCAGGCSGNCPSGTYEGKSLLHKDRR